MQRIARSWIGVLAACLAAMPLSASVSIYMTPEDLARRSRLIVEGVVERTASGYDPEEQSLSTYVTLQVTTVHRGPPRLERVVLREPGGQVGPLVHEVDAVPEYVPGERVFAFLEPGKDGVLRTTGMFYGKYRLDGESGDPAEVARRDLQGQGRIYGGPGPRLEKLPLRDLIAVAATVRGRAAPARASAKAQASGPAWTAVPDGLAGLVWDSEPEPLGSGADGAAAPRQSTVPALRDDQAAITARFAPMSWSHPTRWYQADSGFPVTINVQPGRDPLGDEQAALAEIERAMAAWTAIPEARVTLRLGDGGYDYTETHDASPASRYAGTNIVLFDDPYDDISDPVGCSGVLAIGGYWRFSMIGSTVNNVSFFPALQLYVIFNDGFECFLGDPDNLAEIAAHELGHGLGFGHSDAPDSIMRSFPYGGRGPRLGDDDRDAAHCHYPHEFEILRPGGGEVWEAGALESIVWNSTEEEGSDPGLVDLEYSTDLGATWKAIASGVANDGHHGWVVPDEPGDEVMLRLLRRHRSDSVPSVYPEFCSGDRSAVLEIVPAPGHAGAIPAGRASGLRIERKHEQKLKLIWGPSCSSGADDYAVYEGSLAALRAGEWDHRPLECSAGPDLSEHVVPSPGNRYYLVAPLAGSSEGSYGSSSSGAPRPPASAACAPREETASSCP